MKQREAKRSAEFFRLSISVISGSAAKVMTALTKAAMSHTIGSARTIHHQWDFIECYTGLTNSISDPVPRDVLHGTKT
jgi:hypothetical protein